MNSIFIIITLVCACYCDDVSHVTTPLGEIQGTIRQSDSGREYSAFEGIPFAKPPIGEQRFEEPEPIEPWIGVWKANFLVECAQSTMDFPGLVPFVRQMSEDCLYINVYVPRRKPDPKERLDVIVHIHGGAYLYGAGHMYTHPRYLMDHDVIFVTFNYRLGILGFLSTEDDVVPGNNGMKDQVLALKWVQENIASFGGNPDSVTITGLSAGGSSVHLHYFSDLSKGLFHRGYAQSGVALTPWTLQDEPLTKSKILADAVGCPTSPSRQLVQCLKQKSWPYLISQMSLFFEYKNIPLAPFAPVVEKGSKAFLKADPYYLLTRGEVYDVPLIASATSHEGLVVTTTFQATIEDIREQWEHLAPYLLDYNYTVPLSKRKSVSNQIREHYFGQEPINEDNLPKLVEMFSDRHFLIGAEIAVREQAKVTKSPVYFYLFNYPGDSGAKTVNHGEDHKYFFGDNLTRKPLTANELKMRDLLMDMLISFAKTGTPVIQGVTWEPTKDSPLTYLQIYGTEPKHFVLKSVEELTPIRFWSSLGIQENENLIVKKDEL